jgi:hypothetical protein
MFGKIVCKKELFIKENKEFQGIFIVLYFILK